MKNYNQFNISATPFNVDLLSGALWNLDILGLNEYDNYLSIFVYEDSDISKPIIEKTLQKLVDESLLESYAITEEHVENQNWNAEWESRINVIEVSERIVIKPSFREYKESKNQIVITIDPKMSFGTGEHETTKIMLKLVDKYIERGLKVLDVGSGTSVLGIAASKLGAENVVSVDNDEWCYINGLENVEKNSVSNVSVVHGTIEDINESDFDIVLANINKNVLIEIKEKLWRKVKPSGLLLLSGLLDIDREDIERQFTPLGLTALESLQLENWIGIVFKKY